MGIQQDVIKKFIKSLDNTEKYGIAAYNEAVKYASDGLYSTWSELVTSFVSNVSLYGGSGSSTNTTLDDETDNFLKTYCGIDLTNDDTGAITGYDAGGSDTVKNSMDIVPESNSATVYPTGSSTTYNGLKIKWPTIKTSSYSDKEKEIITGLYTWWLQSALNLVEESTGLSFNEDDVISKTITVKFIHSTSSSLLASANLYNITINTPKWTTLDITGAENSGKKAAGLYFDRVLAHELTHAVISTNVTADVWNNSLVCVDEGLAELVHGADDGRIKEIVNLSQAVNVSRLEDALYYDYDASDYYDSYAAGYMLFRYLAKQTEKYLIENVDPFDGTAVVNLNKSNGAGTFVIDSTKTGKVTATFTTSDISIYQTEIGQTTENNSYTATLNLAQNINAKSTKKAWTIQATDGNDTITGGTGNDFINGGSGNDLINGGSGNDSINGGKGNDSINGGTGDDSIIGDSGNDTILGGTGNDYISGGAGADYMDGGLGNDTLIGGTGNDIIIGGSGNDSINGDTGNDTLTGGKGNDTLTGGSGKDVFIYASGDGDDVITDYTAGQDSIKLTSDSISSSSLSGSDVILKMGSGSIRLKNAKNKKITIIDSQGSSTTAVYGNSTSTNTNQSVTTETELTLTNSDSATVKAVSSIKTINASTRTKAIKITGNSLANTITGGSGYDTIYGGAGNDSISGNSGSDRIYGDSGNDTLIGGKGNDTLTGSTGKDVFVYASGDGNDVITDYTAGLDSIKLTSGNIKSASVSGSDVVLKIGTGSITLKNAKDKSITVIDSAGNTTSSVYGSSSKSFVEEHWFLDSAECEIQNSELDPIINSSDNIIGNDYDYTDIDTIEKSLTKNIFNNANNVKKIEG